VNKVCSTSIKLIFLAAYYGRGMNGVNQSHFSDRKLPTIVPNLRVGTL